MPPKKVKGRKRHIVVDTQGWLLAVVVHPADIQDREWSQTGPAADGRFVSRPAPAVG